MILNLPIKIGFLKRKNLDREKEKEIHLVFVLYLNAFCIFLLLNSFAAHLLERQ